MPFADEALQSLAVDDPDEVLGRTLASLDEAVFVIESPDRRIAACNEAAGRIFGYGVEELLGQSTEMLHVDRSSFEEFDEMTRPVVENGEMYYGRFEMKRSDGTVIETEHRISPLALDQNGLQSVVSVVRDVSDLHSLGAEITEANDQLRRLVDLSQRISGRINLDELYDEIVESAVELALEAEAAALWLFREQDEEFVARAWMGPSDRGVVENTTPDRSELFRRILFEGVSFRENDVDFSARPQASEPPLFEGVRSIVGVPVRVGESPLGVLVLVGFQPGDLFGVRDEQVLRLLAGQAATAIQNARLVQRLHERSAMLIQAQEAERRRIARELHDELGGSLSALDLALEREKNRTEPDTSGLRELQGTVRKMNGQLRKLLLDLRPSALDEFGLYEALEGYVERFSERTDVEVRCSGSLERDEHLTEEIETAVFRIVQEALINVARHAGVDVATLEVRREDDRLKIRVEDEGVGFDVKEVQGRSDTVGLSGIRERAGLLGGTFTIDSAPGEGTRLTVTIPIQEGRG